MVKFQRFSLIYSIVVLWNLVNMFVVVSVWSHGQCSDCDAGWRTDSIPVGATYFSSLKRKG